MGELSNIEYENGGGMTFRTTEGFACFADDGHGAFESLLLDANDEGCVQPPKLSW